MRTIRTSGKRKIGAAVAVLALAAIGAGCMGAAPAAPSCNAPAGPPDAVTSAVYNGTNGTRAYFGRGALAWNGQLYCLAADWSTQLGQSGSFHHRDLGPVINSPEYSAYRTLGENILRGPASMTGNDMMNGWMASPGHAANIISGSYTSIGIGLFYAPDGSVYATQNFGG
jgi:uncharacterized protein YkwD